jgi:glycine oxidase
MADVAILGAGLIGASIGWRLTQAGASVTIYDAGAFGGEASSAGAGMLSPGGEFETPSRWLDLGLQSMRMYPAFIEQLQSASGIAIDFKICGCEYLLDAEAAAARAAFHRSQGIQVEATPRGLFYRGDAFVDPGDLLHALRHICRASIRERAPVEQIEASDHDAVVIAAGAWASRIRVTYRGQPISLPEVKPVKGHLIGFQLAPGTMTTMLRRGHTYVLQRSNGFTIAGSTEEDAGFDRTVNPGTCLEIHRRAARLVPELESAEPCRRWIGFRPYSPDGPHIRRVEGTNVWLAYGHFRNGILLAPLTAKAIAGEIIATRSS